MVRYKLIELMGEKQRRENRRITLMEIARETGVNRTTISKIADPRGGYTTNTEILEKLCRYFGCKIGDLLEFEGD